MRKILIPTDFSKDSLKLAEHAFEKYDNEIVNLILVYPYESPIWESELYAYSPGKIINQHINKEFSQAKNELVDKFYVHINSIQMEVFTGISSMAFKNFMDYQCIDSAILPQNGFLDIPRFKSKALFNYIEKYVPEVHRVNLGIETRKELEVNETGSGIFYSLKKACQSLGLPIFFN